MVESKSGNASGLALNSVPIAMPTRIEVFYSAPADTGRESRLATQVGHLGGRFVERLEAIDTPGGEQIVMRFEFDDSNRADHAIEVLNGQGEFVWPAPSF